MNLQFKISALIVFNYLVALLVAKEINAFLFLLMIQPVLIWFFGKMLYSAIPKPIRWAAKENHRRLDGTVSQRRKAVELAATRKVQLRLYYLVGLVTLAINFTLVAVAFLANQIPSSYNPAICLAVLLICFAFAFEFMRRCYLNLIGQFSDEIAKRYSEYMDRDMATIQATEDLQARELEQVTVPPA